MESGTVSGDAFRRIFARRRPVFTLRMAPMIDMIFLLLIFFLVAAKWRPSEDFLPFQLPAAQGQYASLVKPEPLEIYIFATQSGCEVQIGQLQTIQIENEKIETDLVVLMENMRECLLAQKRFANDPVEIICQPEVKWQHLTKIYNVFFGAGLTDITFRMTE